MVQIIASRAGGYYARVLGLSGWLVGPTVPRAQDAAAAAMGKLRPEGRG